MSDKVTLNPGDNQSFPSWPVGRDTVMTIQNDSGSTATYSIEAGAGVETGSVSAGDTDQLSRNWAGVIVNISNTSTTASFTVWTA